VKLHLHRTPAGLRFAVEGEISASSNAPETIRSAAAALAGQLLIALEGAEAALVQVAPPVDTSDIPEVAELGPRPVRDAAGRLVKTAPREHYPPCEPPPSNGKDLWKWAYNVGACKRVLQLGAAHHLPARTRADVYRWFPDSVKGVYHDLIVKPAKGAGAASKTGSGNLEAT
jgi:hypothetical protein